MESRELKDDDKDTTVSSLNKSNNRINSNNIEADEDELIELSSNKSEQATAEIQDVINDSNNSPQNSEGRKKSSDINNFFQNTNSKAKDKLQSFKASCSSPNLQYDLMEELKQTKNGEKQRDNGNSENSSPDADNNSLLKLDGRDSRSPSKSPMGSRRLGTVKLPKLTMPTPSDLEKQCVAERKHETIPEQPGVDSTHESEKTETKEPEKDPGTMTKEPESVKRSPPITAKDPRSRKISAPTKGSRTFVTTPVFEGSDPFLNKISTSTGEISDSGLSGNHPRTHSFTDRPLKPQRLRTHSTDLLSKDVSQSSTPTPNTTITRDHSLLDLVRRKNFSTNTSPFHLPRKMSTDSTDSEKSAPRRFSELDPPKGGKSPSWQKRLSQLFVPLSQEELQSCTEESESAKLLPAAADDSPSSTIVSSSGRRQSSPKTAKSVDSPKRGKRRRRKSDATKLDADDQDRLDVLDNLEDTAGLSDGDSGDDDDYSSSDYTDEETRGAGGSGGGESSPLVKPDGGGHLHASSPGLRKDDGNGGGPSYDSAIRSSRSSYFQHYYDMRPNNRRESTTRSAKFYHNSIASLFRERALMKPVDDDKSEKKKKTPAEYGQMILTFVLFLTIVVMVSLIYHFYHIHIMSVFIFNRIKIVESTRSMEVLNNEDTSSPRTALVRVRLGVKFPVQTVHTDCTDYLKYLIIKDREELETKLYRKRRSVEYTNVTADVGAVENPTSVGNRIGKRNGLEKLGKQRNRTRAAGNRRLTATTPTTTSSTTTTIAPATLANISPSTSTTSTSTTATSTTTTSTTPKITVPTTAKTTIPTTTETTTSTTPKTTTSTTPKTTTSTTPKTTTSTTLKTTTSTTPKTTTSTTPKTTTSTTQKTRSTTPKITTTPTISTTTTTTGKPLRPPANRNREGKRIYSEMRHRLVYDDFNDKIIHSFSDGDGVFGTPHVDENLDGLSFNPKFQSPTRRKIDNTYPIEDLDAVSVEDYATFRNILDEVLVEDQFSEMQCIDFRGRARLLLTHRPPLGDVDCFSAHWESSSPDLIMRDCFIMDNNATGVWWGLGDMTGGALPLSKLGKMGETSLYSGEIERHSIGGLLRRVWISSKGILVSVPLASRATFSMNATKNNVGEFCLNSESDINFNLMNAKQNPVLDYTLCTAPNVTALLSNLREIERMNEVEYASSKWRLGTQPIPDPSLLKPSDPKITQPVLDEIHERLDCPVWRPWIPHDDAAIDQKDVLEYASKIATSSQIACGHVLLPLSWQKKLGDLDFDERRFKDPKLMIETLLRKGLRLALTLSPLIDTETQRFKNSTVTDILIRQINSTLPILVATGRAKSAGVLDFSNPNTVGWYAGEIERLKQKYGIDRFHLSPINTQSLPPFRHQRNVHQNPDLAMEQFIYAVSQVKAPISTDAAIIPVDAPTFLTAGHGDASWEMLEMLPNRILSISAVGGNLVDSGVVGGWSNQRGHIPDRELYIRWMTVSAFLPAMQISVLPSMYDTMVQTHANNLWKLRKELVLPKFKENLAELLANGHPLVSPFAMVFPKDPRSVSIGDQWMVAKDIMVAPILLRGRRARDIYLPPGIWKDGMDDQLLKGKRWLRNYIVPLGKIPYFQLMTPVRGNKSYSSRRKEKKAKRPRHSLTFSG